MLSAPPSNGPPDAEVSARLRMLLAPGLSPRALGRLIRHFGCAARAVRADVAAVAAVRGIGEARARLLAAVTAQEVDAEARRSVEAGVILLIPGSPGWPGGLDSLCDPPVLLYARGTPDEADQAAVAVVGSRRASSYGLSRARALAAELGALGITVVSGLARGVDTAAHRGALSGGGRTIAVLGGGLAQLYPPENLPLAREIAAGRGMVLSEFPLDAPPRPYHFPRRNRILAALSRAVVVVEASERSGSLITADHALDIGREVLAVPGRVDNPNARGAHKLLREGAALCEGAVDVLRALGIEPLEAAAAAPAARATTPSEAAVLTCLQGEERHADDVLAVTGLAVGDGLEALAALELRGVLTLGADGRYRIP